MKLHWIFSTVTLVLATACGPTDPFNIYNNLDNFDATVSTKGALPPRSRIIISDHAAIPQEAIVVGGENDVPVHLLQMCSTGEPMALMDFSLENTGDDQAISLVTVEYRDTGRSMTTSHAALASGIATFTSEDMYIPRCSRNRAIMAVYVDICDYYSCGTTPEMTIQLNWTNSGAQAQGLFSGDMYNHRAMRNWVSGPEMTWHDTVPTITPNSSSPWGTSIPGMNEVLRFNITADNNEDVDPLDGFTFEFNASDNASTNWNTCAELADPDVFELYNLSMHGTTVTLDNDSDWTFYSQDGTECSSAPSDQLGYAVIENLGEIVAAGDTYTYSLYFNSSYGLGASATNDDSIQFNITNLSWSYDLAGSDIFDGTLVDDLPLTGNAQMF